MTVAVSTSLASAGDGSPVADWCRDFAGRFSSACGALLSKHVEVTMAPIAQATAQAFLASADDATCCFALQAESPDGRTGPAWCDITLPIAAVVIRKLLGYSTPGTLSHQPLTPTEHRLLTRIVDAAAESLRQCHPSGLSVRPADAPQPPGPAPEMPMTLYELAVTVARREGAVRLCVPAELTTSPNTVAAATTKKHAGPLEVTVTVPDVAAPADWHDMSPGEVLRTQLPVDEEVIVRVAGVPKYAARLGQFHGHRAVVITRRLL